jgi:hypothetical protein
MDIVAEDEIRRVLREEFSDGASFNVAMVARAAGASPQDVTSVLASFEDGELAFEGKVEFRDANGALVDPAYGYRYIANG